jgi:dolichyl-phosphate-mannose--protein O-mannosyl transferase
MNSSTRQYLFGAIFLAVGIYDLYTRHYLDALLFCLAGLAFIVNTLTNDPRMLAYKKTMVIVSWVLIVATGIAFLYWLQFKVF